MCMPPKNSAFDLYLVPNKLPIFTPIAEQINVIHPINNTADTISTFKNANVPTRETMIAIVGMKVERKLCKKT